MSLDEVIKRLTDFRDRSDIRGETNISVEFYDGSLDILDIFYDGTEIVLDCDG